MAAVVAKLVPGELPGRALHNITSTSLNPNAKIVINTRPTPIQAKAFALLDVNPACSQ
jgi:hypothetical protein